MQETDRPAQELEPMAIRVLESDESENPTVVDLTIQRGAEKIQLRVTKAVVDPKIPEVFEEMGQKGPFAAMYGPLIQYGNCLMTLNKTLKEEFKGIHFSKWFLTEGNLYEGKPLRHFVSRRQNEPNTYDVANTRMPNTLFIVVVPAGTEMAIQQICVISNYCTAIF